MPSTLQRLWNPLARLGRFYALTLLVSAGLLRAFAEVAEHALSAPTQAVNAQILLAIHAYASAPLDALALACAAIGSAWGILLASTAFGAWLVRRGHRVDAATLGVAIAGGGVLTLALKRAFQQARPALWDKLVSESSFSFPSGHASLSLCLYGFIASWLVAQAPSELRRWVAAAALVSFALLIGVSRMYLGVHWPTDVAAGWIVAVFWLVVCLIGRRYLMRRRARRVGSSDETIATD